MSFIYPNLFNDLDLYVNSYLNIGDNNNNDFQDYYKVPFEEY